MLPGWPQGGLAAVVDPRDGVPTMNAQHPHTHMARIAAATALVVITLLAALLVMGRPGSDTTAQAADSGAAYVDAAECPEATAQFVELGLEPPDTYMPACPANAERLGRDLAQAIEPAPRSAATVRG